MTNTSIYIQIGDKTISKRIASNMLNIIFVTDTYNLYSFLFK